MNSNMIYTLVALLFLVSGAGYILFNPEDGVMTTLITFLQNLLDYTT